MKSKKMNFILMAVAFCVASQFTYAQEGQKEIAMANTVSTSKIDNWLLLGSHVVDYTIDRDVISLKETAGMYTSLKFTVKNGPINLHKCTVHFEEGSDQDISFATSTGQERVVDLKGNTRKINKITFWYDTKGSADQKAVVEVYGKK